MTRNPPATKSRCPDRRLVNSLCVTMDDSRGRRKVGLLHRWRGGPGHIVNKSVPEDSTKMTIRSYSHARHYKNTNGVPRRRAKYGGGYSENAGLGRLVSCKDGGRWAGNKSSSTLGRGFYDADMSANTTNTGTCFGINSTSRQKDEVFLRTGRRQQTSSSDRPLVIVINVLLWKRYMHVRCKHDEKIHCRRSSRDGLSLTQSRETEIFASALPQKSAQRRMIRPTTHRGVRH